MFNRWKLILVLMLCGILFSSCENSDSQTESHSEEETRISQDEMPVYALITKEESNLYMQKMEEGFKKGCEEIGVTPVCYGPSDYSAQAQIGIIEKLIESHVNVIAIAANDADVLQESLKRAMDQGIVVISLDSAVNKDSRMLHIQPADPEKVGRVLIQAATSMIGNTGTVGIITTTGYATNQNLWIKWLKQEVEDYPEKYKDIVLLPEVYGNDEEEATITQTLYLLSEYPELDIIITPSAVSMVAVGNTLREQNSDVLFTGLGLPSEIADFIEIDQSCLWFYLWNPIDLGYLAAYSAHALDNGDIVGEPGDRFTAGTMGYRVVSGSNDGGTEVFLGDPVKFDESNISMWKTVY